MKSRTKRGAMLLVLAALSLVVGCGLDITDRAGNYVNTAFLEQNFPVKIVDYRRMSRCSHPPSVTVIRTPASNQPRKITTGFPMVVSLVPNKILEFAADYLAVIFKRCGVLIGEKSDKIITISLDHIELPQNFLSYAAGADLGIRVEVPAINLNKTFEARQYSYVYYGRSIAYAIHVVVWKIVNDPTIQDYILCRKPVQKVK
jgi:hypothetical protein